MNQGGGEYSWNLPLHALDKIHLGTVDDEEIAQMIVDQYMDAFRSEPDFARRLRAAAGVICSKGEKYAVGTEMRPGTSMPWVVNTKCSDWKVVPLGNLTFGNYNPRKELLLFVRIFYGDEKNPKSISKSQIFKC